MADDDLLEQINSNRHVIRSMAMGYEAIIEAYSSVRGAKNQPEIKAVLDDIREHSLALSGVEAMCNQNVEPSRELFMLISEAVLDNLAKLAEYQEHVERSLEAPEIKRNNRARIKFEQARNHLADAARKSGIEEPAIKKFDIEL